MHKMHKGKMMDINWFLDLMELASVRNFSLAASARNVTQPAFSRRIKALENWLGAELVDRSTYPVTLTKAGIIALETGKSMTEDLNRLRDECRQVTSLGADSLSFSALHSIALRIFPEFLKSIEQDMDPFITRINATNFYDSIEALSLGRCDLALCYTHPLGPSVLQTDQFKSLTIMKDPLVLAGSPEFYNTYTAKHKKSKKPVSMPLLSYPSGCFLGKMQEAVIETYYKPTLEFNTVYENSMSEAIKRMILVNKGVGLVPKSVIAKELNDNTLCCLPSDNPPIELNVVLFRKQLSGSPLMESFWHLAEKKSMLD